MLLDDRRLVPEDDNMLAIREVFGVIGGESATNNESCASWFALVVGEENG